MSIENLFATHVSQIIQRYEEAIAALSSSGVAIEAVLLHSGSEGYYFADDQPIPFKPHAYFAQLLPLSRPDQMLLLQPGKKPVFYRVIPRDYWYEQTVPSESWYEQPYDIVDLSSAEQVVDHFPPVRRICFLGENTAFAAGIGLPSSLFNEKHLLNRLNYLRAYKTEYEVERIREANRIAMSAHAAAERAFRRRECEWRIQMEYLLDCRCTETETPFPNIVALDEKSAILHYQNRRKEGGQDSRVFLMDAGYASRGYCADITRTYTRESAHPVFRALLEGMDRLQQEIDALVAPGKPFLELHEATHAKIAALLRETGICTGSPDEMEARAISRLFFPHGLGHLLGLQVHDVGGRQKNVEGEVAPPPPQHPYLRLTRDLEPGMVVTIEPGLYFIPTLLDPERTTERGAILNWALIDELIPCGGVRIEDNVVVTTGGFENLTR